MIEVNKKYGCLLVLDSGNEFLHFADSMIERVVEEKTHFKTLVENGKLEDAKTIAALMMAQKYIRKG